MSNTLLPKAGTYNFMTEPFHCDFQNCLFMGHLGNDMLNAADFHSNDRGYGMNYLNTIGKTWVLSRMAIEMSQMPKAYDHFTITTWVENAMRYFTSRNFEVSSPDGHPLGYGRSIWAMIDTTTRQPTNILDIRNGLITEYIEKEKTCPIANPSRVVIAEGAELKRQIDTTYSDIDINGHVNSIKYMEHVLDLWPLNWYRHHRILRIDIAFVAETHQGDKLRFYVIDKGELLYDVRTTKLEQNGGEEIEVCRQSVKFVNI